MAAPYTSRIVKEGSGHAEGASVLRAASGGSIMGSSGAMLDFSAGTTALGSIKSATLGGSINNASGGLLDMSGGRTVLGTLDAFNMGVGQTAACVAASRLKIGAEHAASATLGIWEIMDLGNGIKWFIGRTQGVPPSAAASPGSLIIRIGTPESAVDWYIKRGDNQPGSGNWVQFQTSASAG